MNKRLIFIALCGMMGLAFASCSHPSIVGTWVEPAAEGSLLGEVGFTLLENGEVLSINTGFREYKSWEKVGGNAPDRRRRPAADTERSIPGGR